jgi:hypothetical protein
MKVECQVYPLRTLLQMTMGLSFFRKARSDLEASLERQIEHENRVLTFIKSPGNKSFDDEIIEASLADSNQFSFEESPAKRIKLTFPKLIGIPPTDPVALFPNDGNDDEASSYSHHEEADDNSNFCCSHVPLRIEYHGEWNPEPLQIDYPAESNPFEEDLASGASSFSFLPAAAACSAAAAQSRASLPWSGPCPFRLRQQHETLQIDYQAESNPFEEDLAMPELVARPVADESHETATETDTFEEDLAMPELVARPVADESHETATETDTFEEELAMPELESRPVADESHETATETDTYLGDNDAPSVATAGHGTAAAVAAVVGNTMPGTVQPGTVAVAAAVAAAAAAASDIKTFPDSTTFREHFIADPELMRDLLCQYTVATCTDAIINAPSFHLPLQVCDADIQVAFFEAFTYECFSIKDGGHVVAAQTGTLRTIQDALEQLQATHQAKLDKARSSLKRCIGKINRAADSVKRQIDRRLSPLARALNNAFFYVRNPTKELSSDGGDTNGELTGGKAIELIQRLMDDHSLNASSALFDAGSNYNLFPILAAQMAGCKTAGIEYVPVRNYVAANAFLLAMADKKGKGSLVNERVAYVNCDLFNVRSLFPMTHGYFFDEAFCRLLYEHLVRVAANTPTLTHVCSFKASKSRSLHRIFERYGFTRVDQMKVTKTGSGEQNTVYIYERTSLVNVYWPEETRSNILTPERLMAESLEPAWGESQQARLAVYERLKTTTEDLLKFQLNRRKWLMKLTPGTQRATATQVSQKCNCLMWFECPKGCTTCDNVFEHRPDDVVAGPSNIHGTGLFAANPILSNTMVVKYTGTLLTAAPTVGDVRYTAKVDATTYIDAVAAEGPHKYVNHSCTPNGRLLTWTSQDGDIMLSIQVVRPLERGDEITVDYTNQIPMPVDCACSTCEAPPCSTCTPPPKRPVVLCLGMVFSTVEKNADIEALVASQTLSTIDGRDTVRCISMEAHSNVEVYTLDKRENASGRHIQSNFQSRHLIADILEVIPGPIQQISLDYFYMPNGWAEQRLGKTLFSGHLRAFADLLSQDGCVYFPFQRDCLYALIAGEREWQKFYVVSFVSKDKSEEMDANLLFAGTNRISPETMLTVYQKELSQEETYCTIASSDLKDLLPNHPHSKICHRLRHADKTEIDALRFIRLEKA